MLCTDDTATLFRRDSMATKTARNFFTLVAKSYLRKHIMPLVAYVSAEVGRGISYEVLMHESILCTFFLQSALFFLSMGKLLGNSKANA